MADSNPKYLLKSMFSLQTTFFRVNVVFLAADIVFINHNYMTFDKCLWGILWRKKAPKNRGFGFFNSAERLVLSVLDPQNTAGW